MRKLASIQEISEIHPIENADSLEVANILGWHVVVRKGHFKPGDKVVYCEIDSLLPERPEFEFLRKNCYRKAIIAGDSVILPAGFRIRTVLLRGQVSQGICFPLDILPQEAPIDIDTDVTELLGIIKYDPPIPACLGGEVLGSFPPFISKTDETRVQVLKGKLIRNAGEKLYITEKVDGSSCTLFHAEGYSGVCGRNYLLDPYDPSNTMCQIVEKFGLFDKIQSISAALGKGVAIQGEVLGPGIQGNKYALREATLKVFNVLVVDNGRSSLANLSMMLEIVKELGLETVPQLGTIILGHTVDELVEMSKGTSKLNPKVHREGIVLRKLTHEPEPLGWLSFKVINPDFLLKYE